MTRRDKKLLALIAVELVVGGFVLFKRWNSPAPPVPDLCFVDPIIGEQIRVQVAKCRTPDEWAALGETYLAFGYFVEGEACARVAAARDPKNPSRAFEWAFALERLGKLDEANAEYQRAVDRGHPSPGECMYYAGRNCLRMENAAAAREAFAGAHAHPAAQYELGRLLVRDGNDLAAVTMLLKLGGEYPRAFALPFLAHRIEALKNSPMTRTHADRAEYATERLPSPFDRDSRRLEDIYRKSGAEGELKAIADLVARQNLAEAEAQALALRASEWSGLAATLHLARIAFQTNRNAEGLRLMQEAVEQGGPTAISLRLLGDALDLNGKRDEGAKAWTRATELGVGGAMESVHHRLADYHEKANNPTAARWHRSRGYYSAGHELFWTGRDATAKEALEEAVKVEPKFALAWYYLGELARKRNDETAAKAAYSRCLDADPDFGRAIGK